MACWNVGLGRSALAARSPTSLGTFPRSGLGARASSSAGGASPLLAVRAGGRPGAPPRARTRAIPRRRRDDRRARADAGEVWEGGALLRALGAGTEPPAVGDAPVSVGWSGVAGAADDRAGGRGDAGGAAVGAPRRAPRASAAAGGDGRRRGGAVASRPGASDRGRCPTRRGRRRLPGRHGARERRLGHARVVDLAGNAATDAEVVRDLYARAAPDWIVAGARLHLALRAGHARGDGPGTGSGSADEVHAIRPPGAETAPPPAARTIRAGGPADLEHVARVLGPLDWEHQAGPGLHGLTPPDTLLAQWLETFSDQSDTLFLAERDGDLVGLTRCTNRRQSWARRPARFVWPLRRCSPGPAARA